MANFQLGHSPLFPAGTRLFANGSSGVEKLVLNSGNRITLELVGMDRSHSPPVLKATPDGILKFSKLTRSSSKWIFSVETTGSGKISLSATDSSGNVASPLTVFAGVFKNHPDMEVDLIANVFRGHDAAKMYALIRILGNAPDNLINENSKQNIDHWGVLACGTVSKVTGQKLFYPKTDYDYQPYYNPIEPKFVDVGAHRHQVWTIEKREDVRYDAKKLSQGEKAIQDRLKRGQPSVVGITYSPSDSIQRGGSLRETGPGGHTVLIVGCDSHAKKFLYLDPYGPDESKTPNLAGSKMQYQGGPSGLNAFPDDCRYMGMFVETSDRARSGPVLRQDSSTEDSAGIFVGQQFLEVVSGPLH